MGSFTSGAASGAAYVFEGSGGTWSQTARLVSNDLADGDKFGEAVAVEADWVLVGAPGEHEDGTACVREGAVYTFPLNDPFTYCSAKVNSQSCTPAVAWTGIPGSSLAPLTITASMVLNNKPGLLFYGLAGANSIPFMGGLLCFTPPIRRGPSIFSGGNPPPDDCSGVYSFDFYDWIDQGNDPMVGSGTVVSGQFWSRDPSHADGTAVGLTDAIQFTWCD